MRNSNKVGGYRRLAAAIVARAVRDARSNNGVAADAREWLCGPMAGFMLEAMGMDNRAAARWVEGLRAGDPGALDAAWPKIHKAALVAQASAAAAGDESPVKVAI